MSDCKDLAEDVLMGIYEKHFGAKKEIEYLELAIKMEEMRPTDEDGAKLKELTSKLKEAREAYYATFTPMFEEKKRLRRIVDESPEYLALSQPCKEAREAYYTVTDKYIEKKEAYDKAIYNHEQREKIYMESYQSGGDGFSRQMWMYTDKQELNKLSAERDALAEKKEATEEALKAYQESINYHYIASGLLERMNDFE